MSEQLAIFLILGGFASIPVACHYLDKWIEARRDQDENE